MKNYNTKLLGIILFAISAIFLSSCSSSPKNLDVIPEDAGAVIVIDPYSLLKKADIKDWSSLYMYKTLKKELKQENKKAFNFMEDVIKDPKEMGIDLKSDMFWFFYPAEKYGGYVCFSALMGNEKKFQSFMEELIRLADDYDDFRIQERKDYSFLAVDRDLVIAWDKDKILAVIPEGYGNKDDLEDVARDLMSIDKKKTISSNKEFNKFYKKKKDVSLWLSSDLLEMTGAKRMMEKQLGIDLDDNYMSMYYSFEKGKFVAEGSVSLSKELKEKYGKMQVKSKKISADLLQFFPKENYAVFSFGFENKDLYEKLKQNEQFEDYMELLDEMEEELGVSFKEVLDMFKGSFLFSLHGFENIEYTYMGYGYAFDEDEANYLGLFPISQAGNLNESDKEELRKGKTIKSSNFGYRTICLSIKNVLDNGGTLESAIANDDEVMFYEGGWEFGRNVETTREKLVPLMGAVFDLKDKKAIDKIIEQVPEEALTKTDFGYSFDLDGIEVYIAYNDKYCLITNDKKDITAFGDGGYKESLAKNDLKSQITGHLAYGAFNLAFNQYPKVIKEKIEDNFSGDEEELFTIWSKMFTNIELIQDDAESAELYLNFADDSKNSLHTLIMALDNTVKKID